MFELKKKILMGVTRSFTFIFSGIFIFFIFPPTTSLLGFFFLLSLESRNWFDFLLNGFTGIVSECSRALCANTNMVSVDCTLCYCVHFDFIVYSLYLFDTCSSVILLSISLPKIPLHSLVLVVITNFTISIIFLLCLITSVFVIVLVVVGKSLISRRYIYATR